MKALAFGEVLWDLIEGDNYIGGAPFNFSAHMAQCGAQSYIISRLGKDLLGEKAFHRFEEMRIDSAFVQWDESHPTGVVEVTLAQGQPEYIIHEETAYDFIDLTDVQLKMDNEHFDCFYFGTLAQRNIVSRQTLQWLLNHKQFKLIFYDVNLRKGFYSAGIITASLKACNIFKLNQEEADTISMLLYQKHLPLKDFVFQVGRDFTIDIIIITSGAEGCFVYDGKNVSLVAGAEAELVDAVGAGDAFSAAFVVKYMSHGNAFKAAETANQLGAFVAASRGAVPGYSAEIKQMILQ